MRDAGESLRLQINEFADISFDEFIGKYGGLVGTGSRTKNPELVLNVGDVPSTLDWRDKNVVNPVKNQGQCGSCWAFSTIGSLESRWALKSGDLLSLSEQQLVDCDRDQDQGCDGGLMDNAFTYLESNGAELESTYSYTGKDGTCKFRKLEAKVSPKGFTDVDKSETGLLNAVQSGPVSIAVDANVFWQLYHGGVLK